jgi:adenine deaminase
LNVYIIAGLGSDHECTNAQEAMEKIGKGMHIMIRHGTHENPNIFTIHAKSKTQPRSLLRVIGVIPGQIVTQNRTFQATVNERHEAITDPARDLAKLGLIERHHRTGNEGLGFVHGLGLERGAIASSVAHDSHNLIIAGMNDVDM